MLAAERRGRLTEMVRAAGAATTEDLARDLGVSTETIRRDLLALDRQGVLARVHGGATVRDPLEVDNEPPYEERTSASLASKQRIAHRAAMMVPSGSTVMIDVGTTALLVARELPRSLEATIVTSSLRVATELADRPGLQLLLSGGRVRAGDLALSNATAVEFFRQIHFDLALLGSGGIHSTAGLTDYYLDEAAVRQVIIANSRRSYALADSNKFERIAPHRVASFGEISGVIVDRAPVDPLLTALRAAGAEVIEGR